MNEELSALAGGWSAEQRVRAGQTGVLRVKIVRCEDLVAHDAKRGSSDPYVQLQLGAQKQRTKTVINSLAPRYNETFTFKAVAGEQARTRV